MFSRLGAQLHSYLAMATGHRPAGDPAVPDGPPAHSAGRHPISIAVAESPRTGEPWQRALFGLFGDLPEHVLEQVADYVTTEELGPWSTTCREAYAVLRPEQLWRQLPGAVSGVVSLAMLAGAVRDIEQWGMPRASHWLATLAARLPVLEEHGVQHGFAILLDTAERLPPSGRGAVLEALALARGRCAVPDAPCRIGLPLEQRLLQAACLLAEDGAPRPFCMVVSHCSLDLAQSRSPSDWDATIRRLPAHCRATALMALQARLDRMWHAVTNEKAWTDRVMLATELPPEERDLGLVALAVPNAYLRPADAQRRFERMLPLASALPPPQRPGLYGALACLSMTLPRQHVGAAWSRLMDGVAALEPAAAASVFPYLYGALACMSQGDRHECGRRLQHHLRSTAPQVPTAAADITRAPHTGLHWRLALVVRDAQFWITLPPELGATVVHFLRAERAVAPAAAITPERAAQMRIDCHARALESRAAALQNLDSSPGFSLDHESAHWNALLEQVQALPPDRQRGALTALGDAVARSVALFTPRVAMMGFGVPVHGLDPVAEAWQRFAAAARQLPMAHQIELATRFAPEFSAQAALRWAFDVAKAAPSGRKAELLLGLLRNSEGCGDTLRAKIWSNVVAQATSLTRLPRTRLMRALQTSFPPTSAPGWDRATGRRQLMEALGALGAAEAGS